MCKGDTCSDKGLGPLRAAALERQEAHTAQEAEPAVLELVASSCLTQTTRTAMLVHVKTPMAPRTEEQIRIQRLWNIGPSAP